MRLRDVIADRRLAKRELNGRASAGRRLTDEAAADIVKLDTLWQTAEAASREVSRLIPDEHHHTAAKQAEAASDEAWADFDTAQDLHKQQVAPRTADLGAPRGTLHRLLGEYDRESAAGLHELPSDGSPVVTPTRTCLDREWQQVRQQNPNLFLAEQPDPGQVMAAIGAQPGDAAVRGWVEEQIECERTERLADQVAREDALEQSHLDADPGGPRNIPGGDYDRDSG